MAIRWRIDPRTLIDLRLLVGLTLPAAAGLAVFGWRILGIWALIFLGTWLARCFLSRLQTWRESLRRSRVIADGILLSLFLPATLFDLDPTNLNASAHWPAVIGFGLLLAIFEWIDWRWRMFRFHPVALTVAAIALASPLLLQSDRVLSRTHLLGDLLDDHVEQRPTSASEPWLTTESDPKSHVFTVAPAEVRLDDYLHGHLSTSRSTQTLARLVSDDLPPLEDLVIIGHPRPIGCASAIAILSGALFLVYRGFVTWRVPTLMLIGIYAGLLLSPVPTLVGIDGAVHRSILLIDPHIGAAMAVTFANYLLVASPLLLTGLFLATHSDYRPAGVKALCGYALFFGFIAGLMTVFVSVSFGAIFALLIVQALWPLFGRLSRCRLRRRRRYAA